MNRDVLGGVFTFFCFLGGSEFCKINGIVDELIFCGSIYIQSTLAWRKPKNVQHVKRRMELFPNVGLFLGSTHVIQLGSPLENILALYRLAGSPNENIDDSILSIVEDTDDVDKINMSKLF